ncbi:class I SAM-dependent methyltransferase [Corallococcus sp. M34]|uniref:class I SAM-dependent methyltransferase n=1 Tax=Citreicoccus inhibens TaxID=2849499 RepID=UPI001C224E2A|nr:class I SAM-dependent methyltransferase [Citreicoccus inhibens]MBU8896544.1 class I SAM-dependent methyltransferase [Citreicoccus inhibens]
MSDSIPSPGPEGEPAPLPLLHIHDRSTERGTAVPEWVQARALRDGQVDPQQERVLLGVLNAELRRRGQPLDVLEFGCGAGHHATLFESLPLLRYHGYDVAESLVASLRKAAPEAPRPLDARLFCGPDARAALKGKRFDVVFTVSVLRHEPPARIPALLESLAEWVSPEGSLCLIENEHVPFPVWEQGAPDAWLHPLADAMPSGWDVHHGVGLLAGRDVYVFRRNGERPRRFFQFLSPERASDEGLPVTAEALQAQALPRLRVWAERAEQGLRGAGPETATAGLRAQLAQERERTARRQRMSTLADALVRVRTEVAEAPTRLTPAEPPAPAHAPTQDGVVIDALMDTQWAHAEPRLSRLVHVFHQEWHGIRAAAGYAPGRKVAITADRPLTESDLRRVAEACERFGSRAVLFHGFSPNALEVARMLRHVFGHAVRLYCAWHGSTTQFHFDVEVKTFSQLLELRADGTLDGLACVKPEMSLLSPLIHPRTLLNLPPRIAPEARRYRTPSTRAAFVPTPANWWKNFFTNVFVAATSSRLDTVFVTNPFHSNPVMPVRASVVNAGRLDRAALFRLIGEVDVLFNVTLTECQPMTALEGLAHGVACLTGPLSLGALDSHPYQRLVQVTGTGSLGEMSTALERLLVLRERSPDEYAQTLDDYIRVLCSEAVHRYLEFTQP